MADAAPSPQDKGPMWKRVLAFILDLLGSFVLFGWIIAKFTGETTEEGFYLTGGSAFLLFALVIAYFVIFNKFLGGTIGKRIFGIHK
ncbi:MAG: RDD family protein [Verrucomicrobia bacterium]|nr:RDD family protein [Verrucomicrobiota bacterium]